MTELTNSDYEMALSVLNNLDIPENTPHNLIGISFAKEAVKKRIKKKVFNVKNSRCGFKYECPECGVKTITPYHECCHCCGQALDWSDTE